MSTTEEKQSELEKSFSEKKIDTKVSEAAASDQWRLLADEYLIVGDLMENRFELFRQRFLAMIMSGRIEVKDTAEGVVIEHEIRWPRGLGKVITYKPPGAHTVATFRSKDEARSDQETWLRHAKQLIGDDPKILDGLSGGDKQIMEVVSQFFMSV